MWTHDPLATLAAGLLTGVAFGFILQKARVTRYATILGQFLFTDFTVLKVMLSAIVTGAVGIWAMLQLGMIEHLHVKAATLGANAVGGLIFGVGMAVLGYCPGTGVAALGDGSRHAIPGVLGMVAGSALFAHAYPHLQGNLLTWCSVTAVVDGKSTGKLTLPDLAHASPWLFVAGLAVVAAVVFLLIERHEHAHPKAP